MDFTLVRTPCSVNVWCADKMWILFNPWMQVHQPKLGWIHCVTVGFLMFKDEG